MRTKSITLGDIVILNERRGRVVAARRGDLRVLLGATTVACAAHEARRIDSWWNTPKMRAAFAADGRRRLRGFRRPRAHRAEGRIQKLRRVQLAPAEERTA